MNGSSARRNRVSPISCITDVKVRAMDRWASSNTTRPKSARNAYSLGSFDNLAFSV